MATNYESFSAEEFLDDPLFIEWIKYQTPGATAFWSAWISKQPANIAALREAELKMRTILSAKRIEPGKNDAPEVWERIKTGIAEVKVVPMKSRRRAWWAAASIAAVLIIGAALWFNNKNTDSDLVFATNYGEMKTLTLPDNTKVILNANSRIRIKNKWSNNESREVWLEGEAFFDVTHVNKDTSRIQPDERFLVYTSDLTVEVLGTSFDVRKRRSKTEVVLQTGRIKVTLKNGQQTVLDPGQLFSYDSVNTKPVLSKIVAENYAGWQTKSLILPNPSVENIIQYLEDTYGKNIILADTSMRHRIIEGPVDISNLKDALFILSVILKVDVVTQTDTTLVLKPRN